MNPRVSVIVVSKNENRRIGRCLQAILEQDYPRDAYEVIVVDASSDDGTVEIARRFPVQIVIDTYGVLGHQRNTGIRLANGEYVAFTDADCRPDIQWLSRLVDTLEKCPPNIAAVTGPNLIMEEDPPMAKTIAYMQQTLAGSGGSPQSYPVKGGLACVISAPNCNAIYRRKVLLENPYDDGLNWGEDAELNLRLRKMGYNFLYNLDAIVWHHRVKNSLALGRKMFNWGMAMARIALKHKNPVRWYAWLPLGLVIYLALLLPALILGISYKLAFFPLTCYFFVVAATIAQVFLNQRNAYTLIVGFLLLIQHVTYGIGMFCGIATGMYKLIRITNNTKSSYITRCS